jgi:hypothetical protein
VSPLRGGSIELVSVGRAAGEPTPSTIRALCALQPLLIALSSCGELIAADAYATGQPPDDCTSCVNESCAPEQESCSSVASCAKTADCIRHCTNPDCIAACQETVASDLGCPMLLDEASALGRCVLGKCRPRCGLGERWECTGAFYWPRTIAKPFTTQWRIKQGNDTPVEGAVVRACGSRDCTQLSDQKVSDTLGRVCLDFKDLGGATGFRGEIRVQHYPDPPLTLFSGYPVARGGPQLREIALPSQSELQYAATLFPEIDPSLASALVRVLDCSNSLAPGIHLELEPSDGSVVQGIVVEESPKLELGDTTRGQGMGWFANLAEREAGYRVRARRGEEIVGCTSFFSEPGTISSIQIYPRDQATHCE